MASRSPVYNSTSTIDIEHTFLKYSAYIHDHQPIRDLEEEFIESFQSSINEIHFRGKNSQYKNNNNYYNYYTLNDFEIKFHCKVLGSNVSMTLLLLHSS